MHAQALGAVDGAKLYACADVDDERRTAFAAIALGVIVTTGAASAAPVDVLRASDGSSQCVAPLAEGDAFTYSYIQSMYEVPVVEDLVRDGDRIRVLRIRSSEMRATVHAANRLTPNGGVIIPRARLTTITMPK